MSSKAIAYAEGTLGVHSVYEQVIADRNKLDECLAELDKAQDWKRKLIDAIADREADLISDERGKHSDMSAAAFDQHYKAAKGKDEALLDFRTSMNDTSGNIQGLEYDAELLRTDIRIGIARMEELGGYLNYLAAVKAEQTNKQTKLMRLSNDSRTA